MKICHILIENFRSLDIFDEEVGRHNIIVGKNNTGKSNLLWAIHYFYNPKELSAEDFTKRQDIEDTNEIKLQITLTFDNLSDNEQNNNNMYLIDGKIKIMLKAWIDDLENLNQEHHGYIIKNRSIYPEDINPDLKALLENEKPKRAEFTLDPEIKTIMEEIVPGGQVKKEDMTEIKKIYLSNHPEIRNETYEDLSDTLYHGFKGPHDPNDLGESCFIPAIKDPEEEFLTTKTTTSLSKMIKKILDEIENEDIKEEFSEIQSKVKNKRYTNMEVLKKKFNEELELFNTSVNFDLQDVEIGDAFPLKIDILFDDGVSTCLGNKGTGLQRYALFKFIKIKNEFNLGQDISYIFLFEEPEAHLHPQFQREIAKILKDLSENPNYQTFLTTHSPQFIDLINLNYVFIFNKEQECTKPNKCELHLSNIKEEIKTLVLFDPNVREIFFSEQIVLVEGPSEEIIANFLIQKDVLDVSTVSIIKSGSKNNIPHFVKIFNSLKIPYTILLDEDPYFTPEFTKTNPKSIKDKKKTYELIQKIAEDVDETLGKLIVLSPDLEGFLGVSNSQIKNNSKTTAVYKKYKELDENGDVITGKVEKLFSLLVNPQNLNFKISNPDGTQWQYKEESSVTKPKATHDDFKEIIKEKIKLYTEIYKNFTSDQIQELKDLFSLEKKPSIKIKKAVNLSKFLKEEKELKKLTPHEE